MHLLNKAIALTVAPCRELSTVLSQAESPGLERGSPANGPPAPGPVRVRRQVRQHDYAKALICRFGGVDALSDVELALLRRVVTFARAHGANTQIVAQGEVQQPRILLSGWACQQHVLPNGRRQIIRFLVPGDIVGSIDRPLTTTVTAIVALTPVILADARSLWQAVHVCSETMPAIAAAIRRGLQDEAAELRDQIVRLGVRTAYERLVHLMLELHQRLQAAGLVNGNSFDMRLTQGILADALGTSFVHTNRILQMVRQEGLFTLHSGQVTLEKLDQMRGIVDWQTV